MIDDDVVGETPLTRVLKRSDRMITVKLRRKGYQGRELFITPNRAVAYQTVLEPLTSTPSSSTPPPTTPPVIPSPPPQ